jgi:hypothetical protein
LGVDSFLSISRIFCAITCAKEKGLPSSYKESTPFKKLMKPVPFS